METTIVTSASGMHDLSLLDEDETPTACHLLRLRREMYQEKGGRGAMQKWAEELGDSYPHVTATFGLASIMRIARAECSLNG